MGLHFKIPVSEIAAMFGDFKKQVEDDLISSIALLATQVENKIDEDAKKELHTSLRTFQDNFHADNIAPGVWVFTIEEPAMWIEEGIKEDKDMKEGLLKNAEVSPRTGNRYKVIPFKKDKAPLQMNSYAQGLITQIRGELKNRRIPYKSLEKDKGGNPRIGKLHEFTLPSAPPTSRASTGALTRVGVYQKKNKITGQVRRDIITMRTVSSGPASEGKWIHPGYKGRHFLDRAYKMAVSEFDTKIKPDLLSKWQK